MRTRREDSWDLNLKKWGLNTNSGWSGSVKALHRAHVLTVENIGEQPITLSYKEDIIIEDKAKKSIEITFDGKSLRNGGACLYINDFPVPLNGIANIEITPPVALNLLIKIPSDSSVMIESIKIKVQEKISDFTDLCNHNADVLVITPDYPSTHNLYLSAFAHSRNIEYMKNNIDIQVAAISPNNWYQTYYEIDGISVLSGRYIDLKSLLSRKQYKVIVAHFADENLYSIFEGYIQNEKLIFICHGPETIFRYLTNVCRPYFTKELPYIDYSSTFDLREKFVLEYAQKENVEWVFVSRWLKDFSEKILNTRFKNAHCIHNLIHAELFPYNEKCADDRKKILIIRKFDNIRFHSIDQSVLAILELSRRPFFKDLSFEVYGDGNYYDPLVAPLKQFENIHFHRTFIPNDKLKEIHKNFGILLIPSRHDSQGVAMQEAASSGLVVIGSDVTTVSHFMNPSENHTLASPDNPIELADIIERLYYNPDEFLEISKRMSQEIQQLCGVENTVLREIKLIRLKLEEYQKVIQPLTIYPSVEPILTIVVPAYNVEQYLEKCIHTLINHRNVNKTEILVVNDGSKDGTIEIAQRYQELTNGIVRVIDKENGGHRSTINVGLKAAKGRYFRLVDGDDWVDSENLGILVDKLEHETADLVLTKGCYEYIEQAKLANIIDYDMIHEGMLYHFDDLLYADYGFKTYGPLLTTSNYRTECLKHADFHISEKCPYVDMEFNSFSLRYVDTVRFFDLDIYRYLIGREGQTVSREFWKKKYKDHKYVILNILMTINAIPDYSESKKRYVYDHLTALMIDSQIFMYDQLCLWEEIDTFLHELSSWPTAYDAGLSYIEQKNGDVKIIMQHYKRKIKENDEKRVPIIGQESGSIEIGQTYTTKNFKWYMKRAVKACVPYGILKIYRIAKYQNKF